jgi:hypothetical protein
MPEGAALPKAELVMHFVCNVVDARKGEEYQAE